MSRIAAPIAVAAVLLLVAGVVALVTFDDAPDDPIAVGTPTPGVTDEAPLAEPETPDPAPDEATPEPDEPEATPDEDETVVAEEPDDEEPVDEDDGPAPTGGDEPTEPEGEGADDGDADDVDDDRHLALDDLPETGTGTPVVVGGLLALLGAAILIRSPRPAHSR